MRRKGYRNLVLVLFALALVGIAVTSLAKRSTTPPAKKIVIKACAKTKPPVTFDHPAHVKFMKEQKQTCEECHHKVKGAEPEHDKCSTCHIKKQGDKLGTCQDKSKTKNPFHVRCVGCHTKLKGSKPNFKGPTKCTGCHAK